MIMQRPEEFSCQRHMEASLTGFCHQVLRKHIVGRFLRTARGQDGRRSGTNVGANPHGHTPFSFTPLNLSGASHPILPCSPSWMPTESISQELETKGIHLLSVFWLPHIPALFAVNRLKLKASLTGLESEREWETQSWPHFFSPSDFCTRFSLFFPLCFTGLSFYVSLLHLSISSASDSVDNYFSDFGCTSWLVPLLGSVYFLEDNI